jgi:hypothetical protein
MRHIGTGRDGIGSRHAIAGGSAAASARQVTTGLVDLAAFRVVAVVATGDL